MFQNEVSPVKGSSEAVGTSNEQHAVGPTYGQSSAGTSNTPPPSYTQAITDTSKYTFGHLDLYMSVVWWIRALVAFSKVKFLCRTFESHCADEGLVSRKDLINGYPMCGGIHDVHVYMYMALVLVVDLVFRAIPI